MTEELFTCIRLSTKGQHHSLPVLSVGRHLVRGVLETYVYRRGDVTAAPTISVSATRIK